MRSDIWFIVGLFCIMGAASIGTTVKTNDTIEYLTAVGVWLLFAGICMFKWNQQRGIEPEVV